MLPKAFFLKISFMNNTANELIQVNNVVNCLSNWNGRSVRTVKHLVIKTPKYNSTTSKYRFLSVKPHYPSHKYH